MRTIGFGLLLMTFVTTTSHNLWGQSSLATDGLARLKYNNPGLIVDLGVGLWAWPVPCDADGDGEYVLSVSCPD